MHLFGFIIRIYHDERSPERRNLPIKFVRLSLKLFPGLWREYSGNCDVTFSPYDRAVHINSSVEGFVETVAGEETFMHGCISIFILAMWTQVKIYDVQVTVRRDKFL